MDPTEVSLQLGGASVVTVTPSLSHLVGRFGHPPIDDFYPHTGQKSSIATNGAATDGASRTRTGDLLGAISRTLAESRRSEFGGVL
jgi:hypothetical protein